MANLKNAFVVRPLPESDEFIITIGNHLATEEKFKSRKAAEMRINKTDWNLVSALVYPALRLTPQPEHQRSVILGPLVLENEPLKS